MSWTPVEGLVSPSDIAEIAGVSRGAVSNWRKRHEDFPEPSEGTVANPLFARTDVVAWLRRHGRPVKDVSPGERIWAALNSLRSVGSQAEVAQFTLFLATIKKASSVRHLGLDYDDVLTAKLDGLADVLSSLADEISVLPGLAGLQPPTPALTWAPPDVLLLASAIGHVSDGDLAAAVDYCLERAERWQVKLGGEFGSVGSLTSRLLANLVVRSAKRVYDPACGIASALMTVADSGSQAELVGQDISPEALGIASQRAFLRGVSLRATSSDVLEVDPEPALRADAVVAEPPLNMKWKATSALVDPRFAFGIPPSWPADFAWIQHVIAHLSPGGRGHVLTTHAPLSRGESNREIRSALLNAGCVEAVVSLPPRMLPSTGTPLVLWVLRPPGEHDEVLLIDASNLNANEVHTEIPAWLNQSGSEVRRISSPHARVSASELRSGQAELIPASWIARTNISGAVVSERIRGAARRLGQRITAASPELIETVRQAAVSRSNTVTLQRLKFSGVVEMWRGRWSRRDDIDDALRRNVVTGRHVELGVLPRADRKSRPLSEPRLTQPGDVLIANADNLCAVVDGEGGLLPSAEIEVIHVLKPTVLDSNYLAAAVTGSWNELLRAGQSTPRIPAHVLEVPLLPLAEQKAIAKSFAQTADLRRQAHEIVDQAGQLQSAILDAIRYNVPLDLPGADDADDQPEHDTEESDK